MYLEIFSMTWVNISEKTWFSLNDATLSYDVGSCSDITACNKINKPLVVLVCRVLGNVMMSITTLRT